MKLKKTLVIAGSALILAPALAQAATIPVLPDPCATATAHKTLTPGQNASASATSTDSAYYYVGTCRRFIVDMALKPSGFDTQFFSGRGHDIPSALVSCSSGELITCSNENQSLPSNSKDCKRYEKRVSFYKKAKGATSMSLAGAVTMKGSWSGSACSEYVSFSTSAVRPDGSLELPGNFEGTVRFAVVVKERGVPQQAAVELMRQDVPK